MRETASKVRMDMGETERSQAKEAPYAPPNPVHSDFLIHWTGKDLDAQYEPDWYLSEKSSVDRNSDLCQAYLERLDNIFEVRALAYRRARNTTADGRHNHKYSQHPKGLF